MVVVSCSGTRVTQSHRQVLQQETPASVSITPVLPVLHGSFCVELEYESPLVSCETTEVNAARYSPDNFPASGQLKGLIERILVAEGLPVEIGALPWIESEYYISDYSRVGAAGPWQFMRETARFWNLEMTEHVDERYSWIESTRAAARYLRYLYGLFDDWSLAIAAYNCGEGVVLNALQNGGSRFGEIELPGETDNFVPRFAAAADAYNQVALNTEGLSIVMVPPGLDLRIVALETGIPVDTMFMYNRCYLVENTPSEGDGWEIIVPSNRAGLVFSVSWSMDRSRYLVRYGDNWTGLAQSFGVNRDSLISVNSGVDLVAGTWIELPGSQRSPVNASAGDRPGYFQYTVRSGDTLGAIGALVGVSSREVAVWNDMAPSEMIFPGQLLQLRGTPTFPEGEDTVEIVSGGGRLTHMVEEGDTMWSLAVRYDVSIEQIMQLNSKENSLLSIDEVLVIRPE